MMMTNRDQSCKCRKQWLKCEIRSGGTLLREDKERKAIGGGTQADNIQS